MLRLLAGCGLALLATLSAAGAACPPSPIPALALPATRASLAAGRPLTIVAIGSSSTEGFAASRPDRTYPARLQARLRAALPGRAVQVVNRGRGGEYLPETLRRFDRDVIGLHPTLVVWQLGTNDVLRRLDPAVYAADVEEGLRRLREAKVEVVLMDSQEAPRVNALPREKRRIEEITARIAAGHAVPVFSRARLMRHWAEAGVPEASMIGPDGLHHTDLGYDCVAASLAEGILRAVREDAPGGAAAGQGAGPDASARAAAPH